jgi:hypothetical protein
MAIVAAITIRVVAKATCFTNFSFAFGRAATTTEPASGKTIKSVNQIIIEPPPR